MAQRTCSICGEPWFQKEWCYRHYQRWRDHGDPLWQPAERIKTCTFADCDKPHEGHGLCSSHNQQRRQGIPLHPLRPDYRGATCKIGNCGERPLARGWCGDHYRKWQNHGDPLWVTPEPVTGCLFDGCGQPHCARGYCSGHVQQLRLGIKLHSLKPTYSLNHAYFDEITTEAQAYWLGFIAADGGICRSNQSYGLRMGLAERDGDHVDRMIVALGSGKRSRIYVKPPGRNGQRVACTYVSFDSRHLIEGLERLGIGPNKSATVEPWDGPPHLMRHYWRGLFDGDGTIFRVKRSGSWTLAIVGSEACVRSFATWAAGICGSRAKPRPGSKTPSCWYWGVCGNRMAQVLAAALYEGVTIALPRKQERAADLLALDLEARRLQGNERRAESMRRAWDEGRQRCLRVTQSS